MMPALPPKADIEATHLMSALCPMLSNAVLPSVECGRLARARWISRFAIDKMDPLGFVAQLSALRIAEANASKSALKALTNADHGLRDGFDAGVAATGFLKTYLKFVDWTLCR